MRSIPSGKPQPAPRHGSARVTGEVLITNEVVHDKRKVGFAYMYVCTTTNRSVTDPEGWYEAQGEQAVSACLRGAYARVLERTGPKSGLRLMQYSGSPSFNWNEALRISRKSRRFGTLMAYFHVSDAHEKFCSLFGRQALAGCHVYKWLNPMKVTVHERKESYAGTACWDQEKETIFFGNKVRYVRDAVVIFHEYAHAIIDLMTYPAWFPRPDPYLSPKELEAASVCEALADYLACSLRGHHIVLQGHKRERDLSGVHTLKHTEDTHLNSLALSSALWRLRDRVGAPVVDRWVRDMLIRLHLRKQLVNTFGFAECRRMILDIVEDGKDALKVRKGRALSVGKVFDQQNIP